MRRLLALWAAAVLLSSIFTGCGKPTGSLPIRYDISSLPQTLDPQFAIRPKNTC